MATIRLKPCDVVTLVMDGTPVEFEVIYGFNHVTVKASTPDDTGREDEIWTKMTPG